MDGSEPETCDECGFDSRAWRIRDAVSVFAALGEWWRLATDGLPGEALNARPAPGVWSALEYGLHSGLVTAVLRHGIGEVLATDGAALPAPPEGQDASDGDDPLALDPAVVVADLEREGIALAKLANRAPLDGWAHVGHSPVGDFQAEALLFHAVHDATHHWMDVGRGLAAIGAGMPAQTGTVVQVNASSGGVPKPAVPGGHLDVDGLAGDRQADAKHHGRRFQALCLWSVDVIAELAAAGHPIVPGSAGENLTLAGVDWTALRPGVELRIGTALAEISFPATPCAKQTRWFSDGDFARIDHDRNPQWTRWYAWVREPGDVNPGDPVVVQSNRREGVDGPSDRA